jgi:hypothetical protein
MPKVIAITSISHDGTLYEPGDFLDCTSAQAKSLCALGSAKMTGKAAETEAEDLEEFAKPKPEPKAKRKK